VRRVIAHLDLDAFYASVELLRRPELRGKPVIVSGSGPRAVVTTATYEARRFGVGSAMPTSQARRLCPSAILVPPDFTAYREASRAVWAIVAEHVEVVEQVGLDEGYLELSQAVAPKATMRRLVAAIRAGTGLRASVGIGPNRLVAKIASDCEKPEGFVALSREMAVERFGGASPGLLPGIGPRTVERLEGMGILTLAQLAGQPAGTLQAAFGERQGLYLERRARFDADAELTPVREAKSQSSETTFDEDVADPERQEQALGELAADLCARSSARRTIARRSRGSRSSCCAPTRRHGRCACSASGSRRSGPRRRPARRTSSRFPSRRPEPSGASIEAHERADVALAVHRR